MGRHKTAHEEMHPETMIEGNRQRAKKKCQGLRCRTAPPILGTMPLNGSAVEIARRPDAHKRLTRKNIGDHRSTQRAFEDVVADTLQAGLTTEHRNHAHEAWPMGLSL